jgi:hypothetical protein
VTTPTDPVALTNLTGHEIQVDDVDPARAPVVLPAAGGRAIVEEPPDGEGVLATSSGAAVREVRLWRSQTVRGLPPSTPGTRFVVPRLTALAAADRDDLVFPHEEHRVAGVVTGAGALGRFNPPLVPVRAAYRPPGTLRLLVRLFGRGLHAEGWSDVPSITRWTGVTFSVATALVGGALGTAPSVAQAPGAVRYWVLLLLSGLVGLFALRAGVQLLRHREEVLTRRGTAYVIEEIAEAWTYEDKRRFLQQIVGHFPSVQRVPGPSELGGDWHWPMGAGAEGWGIHVDELVRSFWSVHYNDDPQTDNSILMWSWWPVSIAFAARATARQRGLKMLVRQRPSYGRNGRLETDGWRQPPHDFASASGATVGSPMPERTVQLTIKPRAAISTTSADSQVTILLVRMNPNPWGPLKADTATDAHVELVVEDAAGIGIQGTVTATMIEWCHLPPSDGSHAWDTYPSLVRSAGEWIGRVSAGLSGVVLLATLIPQEVGMGIGILAGQDGTTWRERGLWPIQTDRSGRLVIPRLDLGEVSLRPAKSGRSAV